MSSSGNPSNARLIAPVALVSVAIAVLFVLATSGTDNSQPSRASDTTKPTSTRQAARPKPQKRSATYTVKTGDTLGSIAEKTGLDVDTLQTLNPELDPQALVSGQQIKLRE